MGSVGAFVVLAIGAAAIGFALYARQQAEEWNQQQVSTQAALAVGSLAAKVA